MVAGPVLREPMMAHPPEVGPDRDSAISNDQSLDSQRPEHQARLETALRQELNP
jgi:hypothetical protein